MLFRSSRRNDRKDGNRASGGEGVRPTGDKPLRRLHLRFKGQVQGVGFRWNSQRVAREVGATGWVRNDWDGSVEMELQGTDEQISEFFGRFTQCYRQYPIEYTIPEKEDIPPVEDEGSFSVRY